MDINYRRVCRTCLCQIGCGVEFYKINSSIPTLEGGSNGISLLECWQFCTKLNDQTELPIYICKECGKGLHVAYNLIRNALHTYEVLRQKLKFVPKGRILKLDSPQRQRIRCKLCGIILDSKKSMKDHAKFHGDDLEYRCKVCSFRAKRKPLLLEHYVTKHRKNPTSEQLKPFTISKQQNSVVQVSKTISELFATAVDDQEEAAIPKENIMPNLVNGIDKAPIENGNRVVILSDIALQTLNGSSLLFDNIASNKNVVETDKPLVLLNNVLDMNNLSMESVNGVVEAQDQAEIEAAVVAIADSTKKSISCKICRTSTDSQEDLKTHMLSHDEIPHFFCDQCGFYTFFKIDLTQHYRSKHDIHPNLLQLQPRNRTTKRIYYKCNMCAHKTLYKDNLRRHYSIKHDLPASDVQLQMHPTELETISARVNNKNITPMQSKTKMQISTTKDIISTTTPASANEAERTNKTATVQIDTSNVLTQNTEQHKKFEYDLNGDAIFDDLIETPQDKNANCSTLLNSDMLLTSDEEDAAMVVDRAEIHCSICNKTFKSHYKYENHIFLHRGLAPYHCDLCTNLYNSKCDLLQHYMAVHKFEPTRNMLQAKGDKSHTAENTKEITIQEETMVTLMCGNCPFESKYRNELQQHLETVHNTTDERFILSKLLVECPYCIRSFSSCAWLMEHLQHSHLPFVTTNSNNIGA